MIAHAMLMPQLLTKESFAPFGQVIETQGSLSRVINNGFADRFECLADLDITDGGEPALSIFHARPVPLPFAIVKMEQHPRSSQAFIPLGTGRFAIVAASGVESPSASTLCVFVTNGHQGINFKRGVWHHFLLSIDQEQDFAVIDRSDPDANTNEIELPEPYSIIADFRSRREAP